MRRVRLKCNKIREDNGRIGFQGVNLALDNARSLFYELSTWQHIYFNSSYREIGQGLIFKAVHRASVDSRSQTAKLSGAPFSEAVFRVSSSLSHDHGKGEQKLQKCIMRRVSAHHHHHLLELWSYEPLKLIFSSC